MDMSSWQAEQESSRKKMEVCRFFAAGNCAKGADSDECQSIESNPQDGMLPSDDGSALDNYGDAAQQNRRDAKGCDTDNSSDGNPGEGAPRGATRISLAEETAQHFAPKPSPQTSQEALNFCTNCGARLSATYRFCTECGCKVGEATPKASDQQNSRNKTNARNTPSGLQVGQQIFVPGVPYLHSGRSAQAIRLSSVAPIFVPAVQARRSTNPPVMTEVLHGLLEEIAPGVMDEMKRSSKSCESVLLQAMPDHYDD
mmetsp:Transcript_84912/g.154738  ORF Transcript_84912/g.154738 Transcript_84912/m.154738 type:complete len:256 (-) Transcript_84912:127-894(-)